MFKSKIGYILAAYFTQICISLKTPSHFLPGSSPHSLSANQLCRESAIVFEHSGMKICPSERIASSILGACVGDALAAPIHWYYDLERMRSDLKNSFPDESKDQNGRLAFFSRVPSDLIHPDSWSYFKVYDPLNDAWQQDDSAHIEYCFSSRLIFYMMYT